MMERDESAQPGVVLADSEIPMRTGLRTALEAAGFTILAETGDAGGAVQAALAHRPQVCVMAVGLPGDGIAAAAQIHQLVPEIRLLMLTAEHHDQEMFDALRAGADGYLLKTTSAGRFPEAVRGLLAGEAALPRTLTARLIKEFRHRELPQHMAVAVGNRAVELTARQYEVLEHLRDGDCTATIAGRLGISVVTVRRHISAIMAKLGVADRVSALQLLDRPTASRRDR
jgi:DNA-binding NarL/FixJ family response regulator